MKFRTLQFLFTLLILLFSGVRAENPSDTHEPRFLLLMNDHWVDEKMDQLTLDQKIAQLMMPAFFPEQGESAK
ncbi:MAG: hypothetical protein PHG29_04480, partial [Prolixibacteraceae bacterium]|nr:hypothetical protein [Prolixibacteraceae bacterium]